MKRPNALSRIVLFGLLCWGLNGPETQADESRWLGRWVGDAMPSLQEQGLDPEEPMVQSVVAMLEGMTVVFTPEDVTITVGFMGEDQAETLRYKVLEDRGDTATLEILDGPQAGAPLELTFTDQTHIRFVNKGAETPPTYLKRPEQAPEEGASTDAMEAEGMAVMTEDGPPPGGPATPEDASAMVATDEAVMTETPQAPTFVVFVPEQIDQAWYWYYFTEEQQGIVQAEIEKTLIRSGYDVIDLAVADIFSDAGRIEDVLSPRDALLKAKALNATYALIGKGSAVMQSAGRAYNVTVVRSSASVTVKLYRVSDGKVLAIEQVDAVEGGQAQKDAAQKALKTAGARIAKLLRLDVERELASAP